MSRNKTLLSKVVEEASDGWSGDAVCISERLAIEIAKAGDRAISERDRLKAWLMKIDGGDHPCTDEAKLRQWAYEATTLKHDAPA